MEAVYMKPTNGFSVYTTDDPKAKKSNAIAIKDYNRREIVETGHGK